MIFSENLRLLRKTRGLKQQELADGEGELTDGEAELESAREEIAYGEAHLLFC